MMDQSLDTGEVEVHCTGFRGIGMMSEESSIFFFFYNRETQCHI